MTELAGFKADIESFLVRQEGKVQNIYPAYAALRKEGGLHRSEDGVWFVLGHGATKDLLRDGRLSRWEAARSELDVGDLDPEMKRAISSSISSIINRDEPDHTRLRRLVRMAFLPAAIKQWEALTKRVSTEIVSRALEIDGDFDFRQEIARPLPEAVICELSGVPFEDRSLWSDWAEAIARMNRVSGNQEDLARAQKATLGFYTYMREFVAGRRDSLGDDLLSDLIRAQEGDDRLSDEELVGTMVTLVLAGHETTSNLLTNAVSHLLLEPSLFAQLRKNPEVSALAFDEFLRFQSPAHAILPRIAMADIKVGDVTIPTGARVVFVLAAANRDSDQFSNPDSIDFSRPDLSRHIGFGFGPHSCIGQHLARLEGTIMLREIATRMPSLELVSEPRWASGKPGIRLPMRVRVNRLREARSRDV